MAVVYCASQVIWMRRILEKLGHSQRGNAIMFCDNSLTIKISKNHVLHRRCKHIDVCFHFLRDVTTKGIVELVYCGNKELI
jgi:hypothetical protein